MSDSYLNRVGTEYLWGKIGDIFVKQESGKGLSTNDYTTEEKSKLAGIEEQANNYILPTASTTTKGGIIVGDGLTMSGDVLSATATDLSFDSTPTQGSTNPVTSGGVYDFLLTQLGVIENGSY